MEKIFVNGRFTSHHFAIRNVIYNVVKQLSESKRWEVYVLLNKDSKIDEFKNLDVKIMTNPFPANSAVLNHLFTIFILPFILLFKGISVVVYPQICIYLFNPCKVVLYMHDLIEYQINSQSKSKLVFRKIAYPYICNHSDCIVTVSQSTKNDIIKCFGINKDKIVVAYDGKDEDLVSIEKEVARAYVKKKYNIEHFIFYIGYLTHPQKNLIYLIDEFKEFNKNYPKTKLVFAGPKGKNADDILAHAKSCLSSDSFEYIGVVDYADLKYLYSSCEIFCFPSLYEGFGMPVLEAMSCGAVVIASNRSSMPEILNDERFLINPELSGDLSGKLLTYFGKNNSEIISNNVERSKQFSWSKHGLVLVDVINKII